MGYEASLSAEMLASSTPSYAKGSSSRHRHSKSAPHNGMKEDILDISRSARAHLKLGLEQVRDKTGAKKEQSPTSELQSSLKLEILQLEKRLKDQFVVRQTLEKALGYRSASNDTSNDNPMPKSAKELIKEIAVLELEVLYLEQYLLSLYRKAFDQQVPALSSDTSVERSNSTPVSQTGLFLRVAGLSPNSAVQSSRHSLPQNSIINPLMESNGMGNNEKQIDSGVQRSHSSISHSSVCSIGRNSPPMENLKAVRAFHSQPLLEHTQNTLPNLVSLAEHLGTSIADHVPETPNRLSEDLIRCMAAIYCKLADPPLTQLGLSTSPTSSVSSISTFSPQDRCDMWSPHCKKEASCDVMLENPFRIEGLVDSGGPYSTMVEVPWICADGQRLSAVECMLQNYRSLIRRLEQIDLRKMKSEEKLAFWINIHNALVMHAYLAYGIPQNNLKRVSLLFKAAYNIGGHTINADTLRSAILGCRMHRSGQLQNLLLKNFRNTGATLIAFKWLRTIFSTRTKFKSGDDRQAYAIQHPEPLLHFALCEGCHSDPVVRIYTAKRVFHELEVAKEEYIQATVGISKDQRLLLPKILESFARDSCPSSVRMVDMIEHCLTEAQQKAMQRSRHGRSHKSIQWVPHNLAFRYLLSKELAKGPDRPL